jgi:2-C-methyl-D-erythritol 2,4-cyclodiphosphate synthase
MTGVANTSPSPEPASPLRIGHGYDIHRLKPGGRLVLGCVAVAQDVSPVAHSDGDVVIHALVDAILGAMAWGDIGEMFPNDDLRWKDADSQAFLRTVHEKLTAAGFAVVNADVTILVERPRLKPFKSQMTDALRAILGGQINIKAGTNEGCDAVGRGEAVACHAVVLVSVAK